MAEVPAGIVHVVDDDLEVRRSLAFLLETGGFAAKAYGDAAALLAAIPPPPGCVLTDVRMPGMDGVELLASLRRFGACLPVVVMTGHADVQLAVRAMKAGAMDFLEKPFSDEALFGAVARALAASERIAEGASRAAAAKARLDALTRREHEVFALLVRGLPNKIIARELGASPRTIEVHRGRVMEKLGVSSLPDLVRLAEAAGEPGAGPANAT